MYTISNDPRCIKTCTLIYEALLDLLEENDMVVESITISDIAKRSTVGRATFYRHFDSILDVLQWASDASVEQSTDTMLLSYKNLQVLCLSFYSYWTQHDKLLDVLVRINQPNIFLVSLERFFTNHQEIIFGKYADTQLDTQESYLIGIWASINWTILKKWVSRGKKEHDWELCDLALRTLPILRDNDSRPSK